MDKDDTQRRARLKQLIVTITVGGGLYGQLQRFGHLQERRRWRLGRAVQEVYDMGAGDDLLLERLRTGRADRLQAGHGDHGEDVDELTIPIEVFGQPLAQTGHRGRQVPVLERRAVAQRAGFALERRHVMPGVVDRAIAIEATRVFPDHLPGADHHDPLGIGAHGGDLADVAAFDAVAVALEVHQSGGRDPAGLLGKAVERRRHRAQHRMLLLPDLDDLALELLRVSPLGRQLLTARDEV